MELVELEAEFFTGQMWFLPPSH